MGPPINYTFCIFLCHYPVSSQKLGAEKTDHPVESRKEAPSLPDDQRLQATCPRNIEMIQNYQTKQPIGVELWKRPPEYVQDG